MKWGKFLLLTGLALVLVNCGGDDALRRQMQVSV